MLSPTPPHRPPLTSRLARRASAEESGFTLIELVMVVLVLGIMISIAIPSFIGLQDRADRGAAMTTVRAAVSDVEAYYADNGTFDNISADVLHDEYDNTIDTSVLQIFPSSDGSSFTMCSKSHGFYGFKLGPAELVSSSSVAPTGCTL